MEYAAPGHIKAAAIKSPEAQVMTGPKLVSLLNGLFSLVDIGLSDCFGGFGVKTVWWCDGFMYGQMNPYDWNRAFIRYEATSTNALDVVDELNLLLTGGRLNNEAKTMIVNAYEEAAPGEKLKVAQKLFTATPEFHSYGLFEATDQARPEVLQSPPSEKQYKAIIFLRLDGGADSYNMLVPNSGCSDDNDLYDNYNKTRTGLAIDKVDLLKINTIGSDQGCDTFGLHPDLKHFQDLYDDENLLWIANMGVLQQYVDNENWWSMTGETSLFAHNIQSREVANMDIYEDQAGRGIGGRIVDVLTRNGFNANSISADGIADFLVSNLSSQIIVDGDGVDKFDPMSEFVDDPNKLLNKIRSLNNIASLGSSLFGETWASLLHSSLHENQLLFEALQGIKLDTEFTPSRLGRQMESVATLMKTKDTRGVDRDVFHVRMGGFDTHSDLTDNFAELMTELNIAMAEMTTEMKAQGKWDSVTFIMTSEFARTLTENTSQGSDHAWGGNYFLAGGGISGGQILGRYPSTFDPDIEGGIIFQPGIVIPTTPYDAMWNGVAEWFGITDDDDMDEILPNKNTFPPNDLFTAQELYDNIAPPPTSPVPSPNPTWSATSEPTSIPSEEPTLLPSTDSPTISPSSQPSPRGSSSSPTLEATSIPSEAPTSPPSLSLTDSPTISHSSQPSPLVPPPCTENPSNSFFFEKPNGKPLLKDCQWLEDRVAASKSIRKFCKSKGHYNEIGPARRVCPITCDTCPVTCTGDSSIFTFRLSSTGKVVNCSWISKNVNKTVFRKKKYCKRSDVKAECCSTCA